MKTEIALTVMASLLLAGCNGSNSDSNTNSNSRVDNTGVIQAVATVGMVADLVRVVGGDQVAVTQICGSGVDPHLYKPTRDDVRKLVDAGIIFYGGLKLEGKMTDTLAKMGDSKPVIAVSESLDRALLLAPEQFDGHFDPHVWMDVSAWSECVQVVCQELSKLSPENKETFETNAERYRQKLGELHQYGKTVLASVPQKKRVLITSHDAFNYFGRAYGLEVSGVQGISTESEAGLQQINRLVDLISDRGVEAVFWESSVPPKSINALVEGVQSRGHKLRIGGELYSDAMGADGTYEGTYIGMLDHNITTVATALGGNAPKGGFASLQGSSIESADTESVE